MLTMLDVLIGLVVFFLLVSVAASYAVEFFASYLNLRAKGLERFITQSFGEGKQIELSQWASALYAHPVIQALHTPTLRSLGEASAPSYIPPTSFASTVLDLLRSKGANLTPGEAITLDDIKALLAGGTLPAGLAAALQNMLTSGTTELKEIQGELEKWFDANMQRASGWYKRHTQGWLFLVALSLAAAFNLDSFYLASRLMQDSELTAALVKTGISINPGDGSTTLEETEAQARMVVSQLRIRPLMEKFKSPLAPKDARELFAANYLNPIDGQAARDMAQAENEKNCAAPADKVTAFRKEIAGDPKRTLDPLLDELSWAYLCPAKEEAKEAARKTLEKYLSEHKATFDQQSAEFQAIHARLPKMNWICDVATTWNWQTRDWIHAILGWLATAFMASLGASFWFETLGRLANLRSVGSKPLLPQGEKSGK